MQPIETERRNLKSFYPIFSSDISSDIEWEEYEDCCDEKEKNVSQNAESSSNFKAMSHVIMFPKAQLSIRDVSLMVIGYSIRVHSAYEARDALFEKCKTLAVPTLRERNTSKYVINQLYDPPDDVMFCVFCALIVSTR